MPDNGNHQMEPKSTSIFFHHNMGEMKCPSSCRSPIFPEAPRVSPTSPQEDLHPFSSVLLSCSSSLFLILCCPTPLATASSFTPLQNQLFRRRYLHVLSPLSHLPFTPNPLHFSLRNHCSSALAKGNTTSTQANPWNTRLSSSHSAVHSIWHS